jgi:hypothetical protein
MGSSSSALVALTVLPAYLAIRLGRARGAGDGSKSEANGEAIREAAPSSAPMS